MAVNPYDGAGYGCGIGYGYCGSPVGGAVPLLLDNLSATFGAWSVARKIRTAYSGALIRVRESGGNTEADIPAANGVLDEAALASHVGANSGYITKIYNQDANGSTLDFAQSTTTVQPIIVESGTIVKDNGKPAAKFVAADSRRMEVATSTTLFSFLHNGDASTIAWVEKTEDTAAAKAVIASQVSAAARGVSLGRANTEGVFSIVGNGSATVVNVTHGDTSTGHQIVSISLDLDNATAGLRETAWGNAQQLSGSNAATGTVGADVASNLTLGARPGGTIAYQGTIQELIIWPTDESASRTTWEADMANFYGVTLA